MSLDELVPSRDSAPHSAVVQVRYEVHEKLADGRIQGASKSRGSVLLELRGGCRFECEAKLKEFLSQLDDVARENIGETDL